MTKVQLSLLLLAAVCCLMTGPASAMFHIVGGSLGWTIPPNLTYYEEWAKPRVFGVEDKLLFPFRMGLHNVQEVGKADFDACTQDKVIDILPWGPLILNFTQPGDHYYYSSVGTQCFLGQKLHITVVAGKGSSGRMLPSADATSPAPAPIAAAKKSAASARAIGGWGVAAGLVSFVAWLFL